MSLDYTGIKRVLLGKPFPTRQEIHERLDKIRGLAIFASDPISSNAYATEAIMSVLILLGSGALGLTMPIALAIMGLVLLVVFSYIQTILHYPKGGGAYMVTKDNLGTIPSLLAAAALLLDYILTVSVSVSAGIRAVTSAFPGVHDYRVLLALTAVALITWINLRGMRESGTIFAIPTYAFVGGVLVTIGLGLTRYFGLWGSSILTPVVHDVAPAAPITDFLFIWLVLRAFAAGCTALTGIEAISDGVQAFKPPESQNAAKTMVAMGAMAMTLFVGITFLATHLNLLPSEEESILSQMTRQVVGTGFLYYWVQFFTMMILILAANTGFQDFPRLSSFVAKDGFLPRWMQHRGDRLVFSYGIIALAIAASVMIVIFQANEIAMLPLYALGVMLSFTLSQSGMVKLMGRIGQLKPEETAHTGITTIHFEKTWWAKRLLNGLGATVTGIVLIILMVTKFSEGAWIIVVAIPLLVAMFMAIKRHYGFVANSLSTQGLKIEQIKQPVGNTLIIPVADIHRGTLYALQFAQAFSQDVRAVSIVTSPEERERIERRWNRFPEITQGVQLVCIDYEYRDILTPLVEYIEKVNHGEFPGQILTVVIPEFVPNSVTEHLLHNQTANFLRFRLRSLPDVVVIDVPYHL